MVKTKPKAKRVGRSVKPATEPESTVPVLYDYFDRVASNRFKMKRGPARTFYALAHLLADEHDLQVSSLGKPDTADFARYVSKMQFHKHAASAFRMLADRLLKSFDLMRLVGSERYAGEEFEAAVIRLSTVGVSKTKIDDPNDVAGQTWDAS